MNPRTSNATVPSAELKDEELVVRTQQGDRQAFDLLVLRHQDRVYTSAFRFTGNAEDAADVSQLAFLNAFKNIQSFKQASSFATWLYRIVFNQSMSLKRSRPRAKLVSLDAAPDQESPRNAAPDRRLQSQETQQAIQTLLDSLSEEDRTLIVLKDVQDCSYQEIADIMQIPVATLRSRVFRARMELKRRLETKILTDL